MTRNLKAIGLVLVAALALSALGASTASAGFEGEEPHGADVPETETALTGALGIECGTATYDGEIVSTPHLALAPTFEECETSEGAPATITPEGCEYTVTQDEQVSEHHWDATAHLDCPNGRSVMVHVYNDANHEIPVCTLEIPDQQNLPDEDLTITDETNGSTHIHGTVNGITNFAEGPCVGGGTTQLPNAQLHVNLTMEDLEVS